MSKRRGFLGSLLSAFDRAKATAARAARSVLGERAASVVFPVELDERVHALRSRHAKRTICGEDRRNKTCTTKRSDVTCEDCAQILDEEQAREVEVYRRGSDGEARKVKIRARTAPEGERPLIEIEGDPSDVEATEKWLPPLDLNERPMTEDERVANVLAELERLGVPRELFGDLMDLDWFSDDVWIFEVEVESEY